MKKVFIVIAILILYCSTCFAEKQEWLDENYDLKNVNMVYLDFNFNPALNNGIVEKEAKKIFKEKFALDIAKKLNNKNIVINTKETIENLSKSDKNRNILNEEYLRSYVKSNHDLIICIEVQDYRMGSSYVDSKSYSYNIPRTSWIYGANGSAVVTTNETQVINVPGGNRPTVFVKVRFDVIDPKLSEPVWSRIDDRSRVNEDEFDTSKPKDVYGRILKDFKNDFIKKIISSKENE